MDESIRILVVDDDPGIREMLKRWGERKLGARIELASDGMEALDKLEHYQFDLLILDLSMPRVNGIDLLERVRQNPSTKNLEVIVSTSIAAQQAVIRVRRLGVTDYLLKPLDLNSTVARIEEVIHRLRSGQGRAEHKLKGTVLVADKETEFRQRAEEAFRDSGAEFLGAKDLAELMLGALQSKPDLIFLSDNLAGLRLDIVVPKLKEAGGSAAAAVCLVTSVDHPGKFRISADSVLRRTDALARLRDEAAAHLAARGAKSRDENRPADVVG